MSLIERGEFILHSGSAASFLINCDALSNETLDALAKMYSDIFEYGKVWGVPNGGHRFAAALAKYSHPGSDTILIADDVYTTGASMNELHDHLVMNGYDTDLITGVVIFNRSYSATVDWVTYIFDLNPLFCPFHPTGDDDASDTY
jgi:orotate phosphoribosyltransferase